MRPEALLNIDGAEFANGYRAWIYLRAGLAPIEAGPVGCVCSALLRDLGSPTLTVPSGAGGGQAAPWYVASEPESADFLGIMLTDVEGLDSSSTVSEVTDAGLGGGNASRQIEGPRELVFRAWLMAATDDGLEYGRRWMIDRLAQCDPCGTSSITLRTACPPGDGSDDARGKWTLYGVVMTAPPAPTNRPEVDACPYLDEVEWTMTATDPWLYADPVACVASSVGAPVTLVPQAAGPMPALQWLGLTGAQPAAHECVVAAPKVGRTAPVVTIIAGTARPVTCVAISDDSGVWPSGQLFPSDALFPSDGDAAPLLPTNGSPPRAVIVTVPAGGTLVVDAGRRVATLTVDGVASDGSYLLAAPDGAGYGFPDVGWCAAGRVAVTPLGWCSDDGTATILIQSRNRQR